MFYKRMPAPPKAGYYDIIYADPPWPFQTYSFKGKGRGAEAHYDCMKLSDIKSIPVGAWSKRAAVLYLWCTVPHLKQGIDVVEAWGFSYKSNIVWHKIRKDGGSDGRGVGFYFRNVTELLLFGVRGKNARTEEPGRSQVNYVSSRKREHSRKPDEQYALIERCSKGPYLELFARGVRSGWTYWGDQAVEEYRPTWKTYDYNSTIKMPERSAD